MCSKLYAFLKLFSLVLSSSLTQKAKQRTTASELILEKHGNSSNELRTFRGINHRKGVSASCWSSGSAYAPRTVTSRAGSIASRRRRHGDAERELGTVRTVPFLGSFRRFLPLNLDVLCSYCDNIRRRREFAKTLPAPGPRSSCRTGRCNLQETRGPTKNFVTGNKIVTMINRCGNILHVSPPRFKSV